MTIRHSRVLSCALLALCAAAPIASAQDASTYYTVVHAKDFAIDWKAHYRTADERTAATRKRLRHELDVAYGDDVKQKLDLYFPKTKTSNAPVFLFLHGGGFREGDRAQYGYIAEPFAARGIVVAVASYRLTVDGFSHPAQPEDAKKATAWLYHNIARYGGDPNSLYIGGHSAGSILAADLGADVAWLDNLKVPRSALRGMICISSAYDMRGSKRPEYLPTLQAEEQASALLHIRAPVPTALIVFGSGEAMLKTPSETFTKALNDKGVKAELLFLDGKDHSGTVLDLGDADSELTRAILKMIGG